MKHLKLLILFSTALCFAACGNTTGSKTEETSEDSVVTCESVKDSLLATIDEEKHLESLISWAPDTACVMNPELLLLGSWLW